MVTEIEKRIEEYISKLGMTHDRNNNPNVISPSSIKLGAKFVLEMPEIRNVLDFYAGNYMDGCKCSNERTCFLCRDYFFLKKAGFCE